MYPSFPTPDSHLQPSQRNSPFQMSGGSIRSLSAHRQPHSCPHGDFDVFLLRASCIVFVRCALCPNISPSSLFSSASGPIWVRCPISNVKESVHFQVMCGCWVVRRRDVSAYSDHVNKPRLTTDYHADDVGTLAESAHALQDNLQPFPNIS